MDLSSASWSLGVCRKSKPSPFLVRLNEVNPPLAHLSLPLPKRHLKSLTFSGEKTAPGPSIQMFFFLQMFQIPKNPNLSLECIKGSNPILGISQNSPGFLGNNWKNWIRLTCKVFEVPKYLLTSEEPFQLIITLPTLFGTHHKPLN